MTERSRSMFLFYLFGVLSVSDFVKVYSAEARKHPVHRGVS